MIEAGIEDDRRQAARPRTASRRRFWPSCFEAMYRIEDGQLNGVSSSAGLPSFENRSPRPKRHGPGARLPASRQASATTRAPSRLTRNRRPSRPPVGNQPGQMDDMRYPGDGRRRRPRRRRCRPARAGPRSRPADGIRFARKDKGRGFRGAVPVNKPGKKHRSDKSGRAGDQDFHGAQTLPPAGPSEKGRRRSRSRSRRG